jgi:tape measure domain-containing protein
MDATGLQLKIDSKGAQQDLLALSNIFTKTGKAADKLDSAISRMAASAEANLTRASRSMSKYAEVAALMSKIKIAGGSQQIQEMSRALDGIGRARGLSPEKIASVRELGKAISSLRVPQSASGLASFLNTIASARAPTPSTINRLEKMFVVLSTAKEMPGASKITAQLNNITAAATRASHALNSVGGGRSSVSSIGSGAARNAGGAEVAAVSNSRLNRSLIEGAAAAKRSNSTILSMNRGLGDLSERFSLVSQAGSLFSTVLASLAVGSFVRSLYDANTQLLKLQKAVLFSTGTFTGASDATDKYISMSMQLGLSIKDNIDTYGRFVIAAKASNLSLDQTNKTYHAVGQALTVVGASAQQQQLALYGLTEMLQKGIVYTKEFVRQIGAQLPGNAILGARALSQLEGHVVSVAEFFQKMHSGTLLSPEFVPAWTAAVEKMYSPLLALAQARPDVALARLNDAFFIFARQVGQGSFMTAIGGALTGLMNKFIMTRDGVDMLTPQAEKLADTLGHGLASSIHTLGDSLSFIVDHFDILFTMLKGFVAYKLVREFEAIGASALTTAAKLGGFSAASRASSMAEAALVTESHAMATQTAVQAIAAPAASAAATIGNLASGLSFGRRAPRSAFQRPSLAASGALQNSFGRRLDLPLFNYADARESAAARFRPNTESLSAPLSGPAMRAGLGYTEEASNFGARAAGIGKGIFKGLTVAMSAMGPIAMTSAIALAMFSDRLTGVKTAAGNAVTYGDIASGAIQSVIDSVGGFVKSLAGAGSALSHISSNEIFGKLVGGLLALGKAVVSALPALAASVDAILGTWLSDLINLFVRGGQAINAALHLNFAGAAAIWAQGVKDRQSFATSEGNAVRAYTSAADVGNDYRQIMAASQRDADSRGATTKQDTSQQRALEASLRQQNAAQIIEHAAQTFADASLGMNQLTDKIDPTKLMQNIRDFATGKNPNAGLTPAQIAAAGPGANQDVKRIVGDAAKAAGIDPAVLFNLGISETHFDPRQYGYSKGGTSARGPFQLTTGALSDLSKAGFNTSDPYSFAGSAPLAAQYLKMSQDQFRRSAGRDLLPYEAMLPYKLGGAGAGLLARIQDSGAGDTTLATSLFPTAAKAAGNHSLFYAGKDNSTPLTASMLYAKIVGMAEGSTPRDNGETSDISALATGQGGGSAADAKINSIADESYKKVMAFVGEGSPALAGMAAFQEKMIALKDTFQQMQAKAATNPWVKTFFANPEIIDGINRAMAELKKKADEAASPIATLTKYNKEANDVTALRVKGLTDEADWQTEVNRLVKEGYTLDEIGAKGQRDAYLAENDRADVLKTQVDLQKQLNEIEVKRLARTSNSAVDNLVNAQILANAKPGELLAQARTAQANQIPYYQQSAVTQVAGSRDEVIQGFGESIGSIRQGSGLDASAKAFQSDYISALQKMTGLSTDSLSRLSTAASDADKMIAAAYASAKQILENPPGFQRWADSIEPLAKKLEDIKANFAEGLSGTLTDIAVGDEKPGVAFKKLFDDTRKQTVKAQFDTLLSGIVKSSTPQTPEQQQMVAATTFATGADAFSSAVATFAQTVAVAGGATPAQAANATTDLMNANAGGAGTTSQDWLSPVTVTPMQSITGANDNTASAAPSALTAIGNLFGIKSTNTTGQNIANGTMSLISDLGPLVANLFKKTTLPTAPQTNVLGQMSQNSVTGTAQSGQANILGGILSMIANAVLGQANGAASAATGANGSLGDYLSNFGGSIESQFSNGFGDISSFASKLYDSFSEGGYSTSPVSRIATTMSFANAPSYADGTTNTSNAIPAILHPNEAVIPLSRNRKIPMEGGNDNQPMNFSSNITIVAPNPDAFRQSRGSMQREQNRTLKRAALRNLTGAQ